MAIDTMVVMYYRCRSCFHMFVTNVDFSPPVYTLQTCTEAIPFATVVNGIQDGAQGRTYPTFGNLGTILRPIRLNQACLGITGLDGKALLAPEIDHFGIDFFGGLIHYQPAEVTITHDADAFGCRENAIAVRHGLLCLLVLRVL